MQRKSRAAPPSLDGTVQHGQADNHGTQGAYRRLTRGPADRRIRRSDLVSDRSSSGTRRSLLFLAHISDAHVVDAESPGRFEFMEHFDGILPNRRLFLPAQRPQELLNAHALQAMIATINGLESSRDTGVPLQILINTGDSTDNCQVNELEWFLTIMRGGKVRPTSGGPPYEGVQSRAWMDPFFWHPDPYPDRYKSLWGFPEYPDLLDSTRAECHSEGLNLPWLTCSGNHDALANGTFAITPAYGAICTGNQKPICLPDDMSDQMPAMLADEEEFFHGWARTPEALLRGPARAVAAVPERRPYSNLEYVREHLVDSGSPPGHGFDIGNLLDDSAHYVFDGVADLRIITLDTVNRYGAADGSISVKQLRWLEQQLIDVHSCFVSPQGRKVHTSNADRLVVICSHHGADSMTNTLSGPARNHEEAQRVSGTDILSLLWRFPNVVLWLNGHVHRNRIQPRPDPRRKTAGFWEVTTSSLVDWPCEARLVELVANANGTLSVLTTMVAHHAAPDPRRAGEDTYLASIHRELAANDPHAGDLARRAGSPRDRAVELVLPQPFPLTSRSRPAHTAGHTADLRAGTSPALAP